MSPSLLHLQVLTFPTLLDNDFIVNEFQKLIEAVDDAHELALAKQQHFPVFLVLSLIFCLVCINFWSGNVILLIMNILLAVIRVSTRCFFSKAENHDLLAIG